MKKNDRIYVAGHTGLVGSALLRRLKEEGYGSFILRTQAELDLTAQQAAREFFRTEKPEYVFVAAARVGGIMANNTYRAQFLYDNLMIEANLIHAAYESGVKKLLFLGSSCIYPRLAPQPLKEEYLLTGELESTNEPYAIAKIAGIKLCESYYRQYGCDFISVMPTNLYGPNDNYNFGTSHVLPALIRKFHLAACLERGDWQGIRRDLSRDGVVQADEAEIMVLLERLGIHRDPLRITLWGSGTPLREFLHVDDMAAACMFVMEHISATQLYGSGVTHLNIGTGEDLPIRELAEIIRKITGFEGKVEWDTSKPDGTPRKLMDVSRLRELGWKSRTGLEEGIRMVYREYQQRQKNTEP